MSVAVERHPWLGRKALLNPPCEVQQGFLANIHPEPSSIQTPSSVLKAVFSFKSMVPCCAKQLDLTACHVEHQPLSHETASLTGSSWGQNCQRCSPILNSHTSPPCSQAPSPPLAQALLSSSSLAAPWRNVLHLETAAKHRAGRLAPIKPVPFPGSAPAFRLASRRTYIGPATSQSNAFPTRAGAFGPLALPSLALSVQSLWNRAVLGADSAKLTSKPSTNKLTPGSTKLCAKLFAES